jgi:hypothetical protein
MNGGSWLSASAPGWSVKADYDHVIHVAREVFTRERHVATLVADAGGAGGEVEPATKVLTSPDAAAEIEQQIAERLVARLVSSQPVFRNIGIRLRVLPSCKSAVTDRSPAGCRS